MNKMGNLNYQGCRTETKNIVISGTNFWNPGDDFVRDGIIQVLRNFFKNYRLNFLFYNFNEDFFPQDKFGGITNMAAAGDLDKFHGFIDAIVIAGLSAGKEIKDLYNWIIANNLLDRVYLIGAGYENPYVEKYIKQEPEATIFKSARMITGRTKKTPAFIQKNELPYYHLPCPAILSVDKVKDIPSNKKIEKIGFSIQLPHQIGITNHSIDQKIYSLATEILLKLSTKFAVEIIAHHKTEYFHFLRHLEGYKIPVIFSSFYKDLYGVYPTYDLIISTRLHACLFANGYGIPSIIINDTDRHTHCVEGFPHSTWVNSAERFWAELKSVLIQDLRGLAKESEKFKNWLMKQYLAVLEKHLSSEYVRLQSNCSINPDKWKFDSEQKEQKLVKNIVKSGMRVFDIGANIGKYTKFLSELVTDNGEVYAFEPAPVSFKRLQLAIKETGNSNVNLINKAIYSENRRVILNEFPAEYSSWNSLGQPKMEDPNNPKNLVKIERSIEVDAVSLDSFCSNKGINEIDYLKLDVEGAEIYALKGAGNLLDRKAIRYIQFEISKAMLDGMNGAAEEIFQFLLSKGYTARKITEGGGIGEIVTNSNAFYENYIAYASDDVGTNLLVSICSDLNSKRRVLNILGHLTADFWLERNIRNYRKEIHSNHFWFDTLSFLNWYTESFHPGRYLEVGVRRGRSMAQVLCQSPKTEAYGFDLWIPDYGSKPEQSIYTDNPGPDFVLSEFKNLGINKLPELIKGNSHDTLPEFWSDQRNPKEFDLILVDGDHTFEGAKKDLEICFEHLAPGGALVFDDINHPSHPELKFLWEEFKAKQTECSFVQHHYGTGTGVAFKPPFDKLKPIFESRQQKSDSKIKLTGSEALPVALPVDVSDIQLGGPRDNEDALDDALPVHFFTIVLNGMPFIRHHIEAFKLLTFRWHWHIVEGVADLKHDTAWSLKHGGQVCPELHRNGCSNDGTSEYIDKLVKEFPNNITVYRKSDGVFWDGKIEMVNAPLNNISEECLLWQVDADELWTYEQICSARLMFIKSPSKTAAYYFCHYFVGEDLVITTRNTYGNNSSYEWLRTWRFAPGLLWTSHEPPRLCRKMHNGQFVDIANINPISHTETEVRNLTFQHYAYVNEDQLRFKELYYGYKDAVGQWKKLQENKRFPVLLRNYFPWVTDLAQVDTVLSQNIEPVAKHDTSGRWQFRPYSSNSDKAKNIIWVRTDSIGDNVLAAPMLPKLKKKFKNAKLTVVCQEHIAELYEASPYVDTILSFDKDRALQNGQYAHNFVQQLRDINPDISLNSVFSREPITDFISIESGAKERIAFNGDLCNINAPIRDRNNKFYTRVLSSDTDHRLETERNAEFLSSVGIREQSLRPIIWTTHEDEKYADYFFQSNNLSPAKTIALFAGAQLSVKDYDKYGFALKQICKDNNYTLIALGATLNRNLNQHNLDTTNAASINLCGKTTIRQAASLLRRCRIALGTDTGLAHIACAVGTPNIILLGGGHFGRFLPYSELTSVVCLPLNCYACNWDCKYENVPCIKSIVPEVLEIAVRQSINQRSDKPRIFIQGRSFWKDKIDGPKWKMCEDLINCNSMNLIPLEQYTLNRRRPITADRFEGSSPKSFKPLIASSITPANTAK